MTRMALSAGLLFCGWAQAAGVSITTRHQFELAQPSFFLPGSMAVGADGKLYGSYMISKNLGPGMASQAQDSGAFSINTDGTGYAAVSAGRIMRPTAALRSDGQGQFYFGAECQDITYANEGGVIKVVQNYETLYRFGTSLQPASLRASESLRPRCAVQQLATDSAGNVYMLDNSNGKDLGATQADGDGALWKLSADNKTFTLLHAFNNGSADASKLQGQSPAGIIAGSDGWLYGINGFGGANAAGVLYRIRPDGTQFSVLRSFNPATEGQAPRSIAEGGDGYLYGTLNSRGSAGMGGLYRIARDGSGFTVLHAFGGLPDVRFAQSLVLSGDGNLYGLAGRGGDNDIGGLFRIVTAQAGSAGGGYELLHSFAGTSASSLVYSPKGKLYATQSYHLTDGQTAGARLLEIDIGYTPRRLELVSFSAGPSTLVLGSSLTLAWSALNASACTAGGNWSGSKAAGSGSEVLTPASLGSITYSLSCTDGASTAEKTATVQVTAPLHARIISLSASPSTLEAGNTVTLSWSTENATACTASGGWSGAQATSGSQALWLPATGTQVYTLACTGTGNPASASTTVTVTARGGTSIDASSNGGGALPAGLLAVLAGLLAAAQLRRQTGTAA